MAKQLEMSYEQEIILETAKKVRAEMVEELREILREQLQQRFGTISEPVQQRIAAADKAKLDAAMRQVLRVRSPDELPL